MTNERDPELSELLNDQPTPEHGAAFWGDLDATLAAEPAPMDESEADDTDVPGAAPDEIELETDADAEVVAISSHPRFRRWGVAVVGIAAVAVAAVIGFNLVDEEAGPPPVRTPDSTPATPDSTVPIGVDGVTVDYSQVVDLIEVGVGTVVGFTPDSTGALIVADAPELGEGLWTLWVRPPKGFGQYQALEGGFTSDPEGATFAFGADGRIAWAETCDGALCALSLGQMQADGRIQGEEEVDHGSVTTITDMAWGDDGTLYLVADGLVHVVNAVDLIVEPVVNLGAIAIDRYPDGPFASASSTQVTVGSALDPLLERPGITDLAVTANGERVAITWGPEDALTAVFDTATGEQLGNAVTTAGGGLAWAPNGHTLFYWGASGGNGFLTVGDGRSNTSGSASYDRTIAAVFSPDGRAMAYTTQTDTRITMVAFFDADGDISPTPVEPTPSLPADAPIPIGLIDGMMVGLLDDENALVLRDDFESSGPSCGEDPAQALWQVPLDGSEPMRLASGLESRVLYFRSPGDRIALTAGCEVFDTLTVEDLANDNNELLSLNATQVESTGGDVVGFTEVDWADDNVLLLTGFVRSGEGRAWRVEVDTGAVDELTDFDGDAYPTVVDVALGLEGELMLVGTDYFASVDEPTPLDGEAVGGLSMNGPIAYNRPGELWRLGLDEPYADFEAGRLFVSRDGQHVLATDSERMGLRLLDIELEGTFLQENRSWPVIDADGESGYFTTDSSRFVYTARVENAGGGDADGYEVRMLDFTEGSAPAEAVPPNPTIVPATTEPAATEAPSPTQLGPAAAITCTRQTAALGGDVEGMPDAVRQTKDAVLEAAANCDYETLASLVAPDFFFGFNAPENVDPFTYWIDGEQAGGSAAESYVAILSGEGAANSGGVWIWPAVATYNTVEQIPTDVLDAHLTHTGTSLEQFTEDWDIFEQYLGLSLAFTTDGAWTGASPPD